MDKKLKYKSEGEMLFGGKTSAQSNNFLNFKKLMTKKGSKYDTSLDVDVFNPYIGLTFTRKKK
tara:strand:- start:285 stop:473 length:189 start_codon:yes stop_codon:yes gene_type:complete